VTIHHQPDDGGAHDDLGLFCFLVGTEETCALFVAALR